MPRSVPPVSLDAPALKAAIARHHASLARRLAGGEDGLELAQANARFLNACFRLLFEGVKRRAGMPHGVTLAAVGSFGRGAVALRSDADVVLLVDAETSEARATSVVEALLYPLWDAGLQVGHQILSAADAVDLARTDLPTATGLLDLRYLAGDADLLRALVASATEGLFSESDLGALIDRLEAESAARHERFGGSVYLLEPDVKSGPGGMRDIDGARWAARARYRVGEAPGDLKGALGIWRELVQLGVLVAREADELAAAEGFLWRVRNRLHMRAGRKSDRLGFGEQEALGVDMGYGDDRAQAAERLMQAYYQHARTVTRARSSLFTRLRPVRRRARPPRSFDLGGGVQQFDGKVTIAETAQLQDDPALALRTFAAAVRRGLPVLPFAREAITVAAHDEAWCERLRGSVEAAATFVELVCSVPQAPVPRGSILGELHDVGLLLAMIPEFQPVMGRVHHDVYHVYTVDVHSIAAVDRLRQLARGELAHDLPLASRLAAEITRPRALFLATLLHDIGKGGAGARSDHAEAGRDLCAQILPRLGLPPDEVEEVRELVRDHLLLYQVATRRDIQDQATIEQLAERVRGRGRLRSLYLLSVSDVGTTSPNALTSWKARMLEELYFATEGRLAGRPGADAEQVARVIDTVRASWVGVGVGSREFLDGMVGALPERYFLASDPGSIVEQLRIVQERGGRSAHVAPVPSRHPGTACLCIVADDRPGLLASIAAVITANWLEILTAEVFSHPTGAEREALDLFWVRDRDGGAEGVDRAMPRLARDLEEVCSGRVGAADLLKARIGSSPWRDRAAPAVETEVHFDDRASPRYTVVEVYARDRPGLLHNVAQALYDVGLSIALSKINTEGSRVADVFYVRESDGSKVQAGKRQQEVRAALVRAASPAMPTTAA